MMAELDVMNPTVARDANQSPSTIVALAIQFLNLKSEIELNELND